MVASTPVFLVATASLLSIIPEGRAFSPLFAPSTLPSLNFHPTTYRHRHTPRILIQLSSQRDGDDDGDDRTSTGSNDVGCKEYITPLDECYNAQILFPGDISWSHFDIYDSLEMRSLKRRFFESGDGTCRDIGGGEGDGTENNGGGESGGSGSGDEDSFVLPLDVCVGPFGPPRPWGKFTLLDKHDDDLGDEFDVIQT
mmetsp:Transcript_18296/g.37097  ORF Transcript_18296/g.37097 Transcript_18296/m.37097 type:complete len:198 (-) Transcript_18296:118-711(-)